MDRRTEYEKTMNADLVDYYLDLGNTLNWKINQLSHIIGQQHFASVGSYKERLLKEEIGRFLPKQYSIGTGFIIFPKFVKSENPYGNYAHEISKQLDIIIYNNTITAPIFQDGDFIVIVPEAVVAIIEVKGTISDNADPMSVYEDCFEKWRNYMALISNNLIQFSAINHFEVVAPYFFVYAFNEYVDKNNTVYGYKKVTQKIKDILANVITKFGCGVEYVLPSVTKETIKFGGFFCYSKYEILGATATDEKTTDTKRVLCCIKGQKDDDLTGDITFVDMLSTMMHLCKIPYNSGTIRTYKEVYSSCKTLYQLDLYDLHTNTIL